MGMLMNRDQLQACITEKIGDIESNPPIPFSSFNAGYAEGKKDAYKDVLRWMAMKVQTRAKQ